MVWFEPLTSASRRGCSRSERTTTEQPLVARWFAVIPFSDHSAPATSLACVGARAALERRRCAGLQRPDEQRHHQLRRTTRKTQESYFPTRLRSYPGAIAEIPEIIKLHGKLLQGCRWNQFWSTCSAVGISSAISKRIKLVRPFWEASGPSVTFCSNL